MDRRIAVLICGADGRVRSASRGADLQFGADRTGEGARVDEVLAATPRLRDWVAAAVERAGEDGAGDSCVVLEESGVALEVCVVPLVEPGGGAAFAVVASPSELAAIPPDQVSQRAWHDIKNQLGGLKLYATFLRKKLGDEGGPVVETANKIVSGIDAVVDAIAEARRGEDPAKGDGQ